MDPVRRNSVLILILLSLLAFSRPGEVIADIYKLKTSDDTFADQLSPGNNYSRLNYLVCRDSIAAAHTYLKFSLPDLPADVEITGAILGLYSQFGYRSWVMLSHLADDSWDGGEVSWNNRPEEGEQTVELDRRYLDLSYRWMYWDLTAEGMWDAKGDREDGNISLLIQSTGSDLIFAGSSFQDENLQPYLLLNTQQEQNEVVATPLPSSFLLFGINVFALAVSMARKTGKHPKKA